MSITNLKPEYIFEVSWEVCNKVGGIHTVIASKAPVLLETLGDRLIMIGPDTRKDEQDHPEFEEDRNLLPEWRQCALDKGFRVRIGRWKITGKPVCILMDFSSLFDQKDKIFANLWTRYRLDSITGQWDYIEPAMFGYAAGQLIHALSESCISPGARILAQFHEWIAGAGVLYLDEHAPHIATVFTTHATALARSIAGNNQPLYSGLKNYDPEQEAARWNITAKHSLEKVSAQTADCFTTVSRITAVECVHFLGKEPDIITPNGFEALLVPKGKLLDEQKKKARGILLKVASAMIGKQLPDDTMFVLKSGRYEFRNKGIDVFIDAMAQIRDGETPAREIVAFIFVPGDSAGPRQDLAAQLGEKNPSRCGGVLTHYLRSEEHDPIMQRIKSRGFENNEADKVKLFFVPVYLDGNDGIFNQHYYELLPGFDVSAFPSYYEPWGYTPLESLAFHVPTVTTNLAGFGRELGEQEGGLKAGMLVLDRRDDNDAEVAKELSTAIKEFAGYTATDIAAAGKAAVRLSEKAQWKNYIDFYVRAYSLALEKAEERTAAVK